MVTKIKAEPKKKSGFFSKIKSTAKKVGGFVKKAGKAVGNAALSNLKANPLSPTNNLKTVKDKAFKSANLNDPKTKEKIREGIKKVGDFLGNKAFNEAAEKAGGQPVSLVTPLAPAFGAVAGVTGAIGTSAKPFIISGKIASTGGKVQANTKTVATVNKGLVAAGHSTSISKIAATVLGTYVFSGFIKEEALQTLDFAVKAATESGNAEGVEAALDMKEEFLSTEPDILEMIPFVNNLKSLKDYFDAARLKLAIDRKSFELDAEAPEGETTTEKWTRINNEEAQQFRDNTDYHNEQKKLTILFEQEARRNARNEDAVFWAKERAKERKLEEQDREAIAKFWTEYRKEIAKLQQDSRPSKLNFGLL